MLRRLEYVSGMESLEKDGHYNKAPTGLKELTEKEFVEHFHAAPFNYVETRQVFDFEKGMLPITMYWVDQSSGYAISFHYYDGKLRFFKFGCEHDWETTLRRMCYEEMKCKKCGVCTFIDSSD